MLPADSSLLAFHHFGLGVHTPEPAFRYLRKLGYEVGKPVFDSLQGVNLTMAYHPAMPAVEVIWPGAGPSPLDNLLKRRDSLIYHLCYTSPDPEGAVAALEAAGIQLLAVVEPRPAVLFGGKRVSFHHVADVGLIEIIEGVPEANPEHRRSSEEQP